eukprot:1161960-Pelagomonas_calceolata.AAC.1
MADIYIRRVESGACGLGAGQGVHFMCWHQCSEGCPTGFCVVWNSSLTAIILLSFSLLDLSSFSACRSSLRLNFVVGRSYGLCTNVAPFP